MLYLKWFTQPGTVFQTQVLSPNVKREIMFKTLKREQCAISNQNYLVDLYSVRSLIVFK